MSTSEPVTKCSSPPLSPSTPPLKPHRRLPMQEAFHPRSSFELRQHISARSRQYEMNGMLSLQDKGILGHIVGPEGWVVIPVVGDDGGCEFAFTIGLWAKLHHPEILILGKLPMNSLTWLIKNLVKKVDTGEPIVAGSVRYMELCGKLLPWSFSHLEQRDYAEYLGYCTWFYKLFFDDWDSTFPVLVANVPESVVKHKNKERMQELRQWLGGQSLKEEVKIVEEYKGEETSNRNTMPARIPAQLPRKEEVIPPKMERKSSSWIKLTKLVKKLRK